MNMGDDSSVGKSVTRGPTRSAEPTRLEAARRSSGVKPQSPIALSFTQFEAASSLGRALTEGTPSARKAEKYIWLNSMAVTRSFGNERSSGTSGSIRSDGSFEDQQ